MIALFLTMLLSFYSTFSLNFERHYQFRSARSAIFSKSLGNISRSSARIAPRLRPQQQAQAVQMAGVRSTVSKTTTEDVSQYATPLQWVHWGMAGGVLGCFGLVYAAEKAKPEVKAALMKWHSQIGMVVLGLFGGRLALRVGSF
jgi:hypothetical protein